MAQQTNYFCQGMMIPKDVQQIGPYKPSYMTN